MCIIINMSILNNSYKTRYLELKNMSNAELFNGGYIEDLDMGGAVRRLPSCSNRRYGRSRLAA